ncbi:hypothetical protein, partial [Rhizobium leguminosarum]|uniref:hypothetical protein n=1 Tax=Rhizobium leguminosarum TaxID=384 RepID=UPI003F9657B9
PRMTQAQRLAVPAPATGLLVYQSDLADSSFYWYDGISWVRLQSAKNGWNVIGNTGSNPATHFIGTTDNQPLSFRQNNKWLARWNTATANYFIGAGSGEK